MAAFPEGGNRRGKAFSCLLSVCGALILLLSSCSPERVLVLSDPGFDFFAEDHISFYKPRREMIFRLKGYDPDFINYDSSDDYDERINALMNSGRYGAVVTGVASAVRIAVPRGMESILVGGAAETGFSYTGHVMSEPLSALREAGSYLRRRYDDEGWMPFLILYGDGKGEREAVLEGWGQDGPGVPEDHILEIGERTGDVRKTLEDFLVASDFGSGRHLLLGYCAPVMQELLEIFPLSENIGLILDFPDDSLLPGGAEALVVPDYKGLLQAAAGALAGEEEGTALKIPYLFLEK